jgi:dynein heavy chain
LKVIKLSDGATY